MWSARRALYVAEVRGQRVTGSNINVGGTSEVPDIKPHISPSCSPGAAQCSADQAVVEVESL